MAVIKSNGAAIAVHDGTSFVTIGQVTDFSLTIDQAAIEFSSLDSAFRGAHAGTKGGQLEINFLYDPDATQQGELTEDMIASTIGDTDQIRITLTDTTPSVLTFHVVVTSFNITVATDDVLRGSVSAVVTSQVIKT